MTSFWALSQRYPPILCRLLARHKHGPPLSSQLIADRAHLTLTEVVLLSKETDWDAIPLSAMKRFLFACGTDFCNRSDMNRIASYCRKKPTWKYLRMADDWLSYYEPLLKTYANLCKRQMMNKAPPPAN